MKSAEIGKNIRQIRHSFNLTQFEFAHKLGVSRSAIQHWETNYTEPDIEAIKKMKEIFKISYEEILDGM